MRQAAKRIRDKLKPKPPDWTVTTLAQRMKRSRPTVRRWIDGKQIPTLDEIRELEAIFPDVPRDDWLIELQPDPKEKKANVKTKPNARRT